MKPDWKDAPEWANYLAKNHNGTWFWFELEPKYDGAYWYEREGLVRPVVIHASPSQYSLEERPKPKATETITFD